MQYQFGNIDKYLSTFKALSHSGGGGGYQLKSDDMAKCCTSKHTQLVNEIQNQPWFSVEEENKLMINSVSTLKVIALQLTKSKAKITFNSWILYVTSQCIFKPWQFDWYQNSIL